MAKGDHLRRIISWSDKGYSWEADPKYAKGLIDQMGLTGGKGVDTPTSSETGKGCRNVEDQLGEKEASEFRSIAGTALYLAQDRPTIQFAVSEVAHGMQKPTVLHYLQLKRLVRCILQYPVRCGSSRTKRRPHEVAVLTDSDWAGDKATRKSISSYVERFGHHMIGRQLRQTVSRRA